MSDSRYILMAELSALANGLDVGESSSGIHPELLSDREGGPISRDAD